MPSVALSLCLVFIVWFLARDLRRRTSVSCAVWLPTLLLLILGSRPVSVWVGGGGRIAQMGDYAETSVLDQMFYLSVLVGSFAIASWRRVKWNRLVLSNTAIMLLYLFFALSVLWSEDPIGSSKRLFKDCGMLFVVAVILSERDPLQAIRAVYFRCACILFPLSVVFIKYYPDLGRAYTIAGQPMFTGVTTQKNSLGEIILVLSLFLVWDYSETRAAGIRLPWDRLLLLLMGAWLLNISQSKTALICLVVSSALIVRSRRLASRMVSRVVLAAALSLPFLLLLLQTFGAIIQPLVQALGRDMTFTGRTDIWEHITFTTVNPLIGAGFFNFWGGRGGLAIMKSMNTGIPSAHCGYLDTYLDGGLIGLFLLFCLLVASGRRLTASSRLGRYQALRFAVLITMILYNLSESTFIRLTPTWFTTLLVVIDFPFPKVSRGGLRARLQGADQNNRLSTTERPQIVNQ
jgi:O-antigen ligase